MANYKETLGCKLCDYVAVDHEDIQLHLKSHRIAPKKYFEKYFPKGDLHNSTPIQFKSYEQYFLTDFVDKRHMKTWLWNNSDKAKEFVIKKLKAYCKLKNLSIVPSHAELKTIPYLPTPDLVVDIFGYGFGKVCRENNLNVKFDYSFGIFEPTYTETSIVIDTREQTPFIFKNIDVISTKLECGDYAISVDSKNVIERKSVGDFCSTLCGGLDRFKKEITRAKENDIYVVVLVEATISNIMYCKRKFGVASGDFVMHNMRSLCREFDNIQFVFSDGKKQAAQDCLTILALGNIIRQMDLQFHFDGGTL